MWGLRPEPKVHRAFGDEACVPCTRSQSRGGATKPGRGDGEIGNLPPMSGRDPPPQAPAQGNPIQYISRGSPQPWAGTAVRAVSSEGTCRSDWIHRMRELGPREVDPEERTRPHATLVLVGTGIYRVRPCSSLDVDSSGYEIRGVLDVSANRKYTRSTR